METKTIDATNKKLGRIASEAAKILMGKDRADFQKNTFPKVKVHITNASKIILSEKKMRDTTYARYSGYPGGLKTPNMNKIVEDKGYAGLFQNAVYGMLPKNKLRSQMIKNLIVSE